MIVCRKCSRRHADGTTFCVCGAFLEFDGERVADSPDTGDRPAEVAPPAAAGTTQGSWDQLPPPPPPATAETEPAPWSGLPREGGTTPSTSSVDARLPDAPIDAPAGAEPVRVESTARPTDIACRQCGTSNPPELQFCRHCGQPLTASAPVGLVDAAGATPPWWRRLGRRARQRARRVDPMSAAATARRLTQPGMSSKTMLFRSTGITAVLLGMLAFLGPWRGTVINEAKKAAGASRFQVLDDEVAAVESVATSASITPLQYALQPADLVHDGFENTAWATQWLEPAGAGIAELPASDECLDSSGTDAMLRFTFAEPIDLDRVQILGGRFAGDEARKTFSRPRIIELRAGDACTHLELADDGKVANYPFERNDVSTVEVRIVGRYGDESTARAVEISEIAFERRR